MRVAGVDRATAAKQDLRVYCDDDDDLAVELSGLKGRWVVAVAIARLGVTSKVAEAAFRPIPLDGNVRQGRNEEAVAPAGVSCPV